MTVATLPTGELSGALAHDAELVKAALLYADRVTLASPRALMFGSVAGLAQPDSQNRRDALAATLAAVPARIPGRRPPLGQLSESERQVAELVMGGLANKEIAARLHITRRTVEAHLSKVYAKLGVSSRVELATRLSARGDESPAQKTVELHN